MAFTIEMKNGKQIRVDAESALIGRDRSCQIALPDEADLHPIHAKIRKVADRWMIEAQGDWQIQVGTGQPGRMNWIKSGDVIRLTAGLEITFLDGQAAAQAAPIALATPLPSKKPVPESPQIPAVKASPPPEPPAAVEEWYYAKNGKKIGPCSIHQLKELAAIGQLTAADLVWKNGMAKWVPATSIKGVFDAISTTPPLAPLPIPQTAPSIPQVEARSPSHGLKPVLIMQTVVAALGFLFGLYGIIDLGPSDLRSFNGLFVCVAVGWNVGVLVTTWVGYLQRSYWFSLLAVRLMFGSWFFFLFTGCPIPVSILGLMISIPVGIWAINLLRKPDVRAFLGSHDAPSDFSHTLLGPTLGDKWIGLDQRQKAITIGVGVLVLVPLMLLAMWLQSWRSLSGWSSPVGSNAKGGVQPIAEGDKKRPADDKLQGKPGDKDNGGLPTDNKKAGDKTPNKSAGIGVVVEPLAVLPLQERELVAHAVQFSADSTLLLSGSQANSLASGERPLDMSLWDVASKQHIQLQPAAKNDYLASTLVAEFSPTAPCLACLSQLHTKYPNAESALHNAQLNNAKAPLYRSIWHIKGNEAQLLGGDERLGLASSIDKRGCSWRKMLWSKDGSLMVVKGAYGLDFLRLDAAKNEITKAGTIVFKKNLGIIGADEIYYPDQAFIDASLSPDATLLATHFDAKEKGIQIWAVPKGQIMVRLNPTERKSSGSPFGFSSDGKTFAASQIVEQKKFEEKRVVVLWDAATWKTKHVLSADDLHDAFGRPVEFHEFAAFSPDGKTVVTKCQWQSGTPIHNHAISVWDVATGKRKYYFNTISASDVHFSPDGRLLLTGGHSVAKSNIQYNVNLWDADTGVLKNRLTDKGIFSAVFAPNGKLVATAHSNGGVKVWDIARTKAGVAIPEFVGDGKGDGDDISSRANRDRIESTLRGMKLNDLIKRYGQPDVTWTNPKRTNVKLYQWKLGGSKTDLYVVQLVIYAIDGRSPNVHENPVVRTSKEFERMKQGIMDAAK